MDSSEILGITRNKHFIPRNNENRSESIQGNFFESQISMANLAESIYFGLSREKKYHFRRRRSCKIFVVIQLSCVENCLMYVWVQIYMYITHVY
jgi:hypothetical protein